MHGPRKVLYCPPDKLAVLLRNSQVEADLAGRMAGCPILDSSTLKRRYAASPLSVGTPSCLRIQPVKGEPAALGPYG